MNAVLKKQSFLLCSDICVEIKNKTQALTVNTNVSAYKARLVLLCNLAKVGPKLIIATT